MNFNNLFFEAAYGTSKQLPVSDLPEIAFSGRSNVGKSSLINKLANRKKLAKVSSAPGKTSTVNFYNAQTARLVDLPGYGYAKVSESERARWSELMDGYFTTNRNIALVVQLVDMRHSPTKLDLQMLEYLEHNNINFVIALTKCDKLNKTQFSERLELLPKELAFLKKMPQTIPVSALNGEGIEQLKNVITSKGQL